MMKRVVWMRIILKIIVIIGCLGRIYGDIISLGNCTNRLRVCKDGEDPYHGDRNAGILYCSENKLQRKQVFLTGASSWTSTYVLWIVQILLEEQLQVPVELVNVNGGSTQYRDYDDLVLDDLDQRVYSWDALHHASNMSMDCSKGFVTKYMSTPSDLQDCTENCKPCAHAMLEIWPNGQDENYQMYINELKTIEDAGPLGTIGEFGWYTNAKVVNNNPTLATYRGMTVTDTSNMYKEAYTFGQFCSVFRSEWDWIVTSTDPLAFNAAIPSHFCHHFFQYAMLDEYGKAYFSSDPTYLSERDALITTCASRDSKTMTQAYYSLCSLYWVTTKQLTYTMPTAASQLQSRGYVSVTFLYTGHFETSSKGILMSTACMNSSMPTSNGMDNFTTWDTLGQDGYTRFANNDPDLVNAYNLLLQPMNMQSDIPSILELSGRLLDEANENASSVLFSWSRPSSLFKRSSYNMSQRDWGGFSGENFELIRVHTPEYDPTCEMRRRSYDDRCDIDSNIPNEPCGYPEQILYKAFASKLQGYAPEAHYFMKNVRITREILEDLLAKFDYDSDYSSNTPSTRHREIVCDWINNNSDLWSEWLPASSNQARCLGEVGDSSMPGYFNLDTQDLVPCSGNGQCSETNLDLHPNSGECTCDPGWTGADCSGLVEPSSLNVQYFDPSWISIFVLQILTFLYLLNLVRLVFKYEKTSCVLQTTLPCFLKLILFAMILAVCGVALWGGEPTRAICILRPVLILFPLSAISLVISIKLTRRNNRLAFNTEDIRNGMKGLAFLYAVMYLVWFLVWPPIVANVRLPEQLYLDYTTCDYGPEGAGFLSVQGATVLVLLFYNCKTAWNLRNQATYFNEAHQMLWLTFLMMLFLVGCYILGASFTSPDELGKYLTVCLSILVNCWLIIVVLYHPKFEIHFKHPERNNLKDGLIRPNDALSKILLKSSNGNRIAPESGNNSSNNAIPLNDCVVTGEACSMRKRSVGATALNDRGSNRFWKRLTSKRQSKRKMMGHPSSSNSLNNECEKADTAEAKTMGAPERVLSFEMPIPEVDQVPQPNKDKAALLYRSPEMYKQVETRVQKLAAENLELTRILQEHHIDPVTGDMDNTLLDKIREKQMEFDKKSMELKKQYQKKILEADNELQLKKLSVDTSLKQEKDRIEKEADAKIVLLQSEKDILRDKIVHLEEELGKAQRALQSSMPPLSTFLETHGFSQYQENFESIGFTTTEKLLFATHEDLVSANMKRGHIRKLQTILETFAPAAPVVLLPDGAVRPGIRKSADVSNVKEENSTKPVKWLTQYDTATNRRYLVHPHTGETKWDESIRQHERNSDDEM